MYWKKFTYGVSLCSLCVLCVSVVKQELTTETQRTQRLHREEVEGLSNRHIVQNFSLAAKILFGSEAREQAKVVDEMGLIIKSAIL